MSDYPTEVQIRLRCPCNLDCWYCVANHKQEDTIFYDLDWLKNFYSQVESDRINTSFECGASEPTLHPQIRDILDIAFSYGNVSIPTNNTTDCSLWVPDIRGRHFLVRCALHPYHEKNILSFLSGMVELRDLGAVPVCVYCATPDRLSGIGSVRSVFEDKGLKFMAMPFSGKWEGKVYPQDYTQEESEILFDRKNWYDRLKPYMFIRDFYGIPCLAGKNLFYIEPGIVKRCLYDHKTVKTFNKALKCSVHYCGCGLYLEELNTWMRPSLDDTEEVFFIKMRQKYFDLMTDNGKLNIDKIKEVYGLK